MKKWISVFIVSCIALLCFVPALALSPEKQTNTPNSQMYLKGYQTGVARVLNLHLSNGYNYGASSHAAVWTNGAGQAVYCIEPCSATRSGTVYGSTTKEVFNQSPYVCRGITSADDKERLIGVIMSYCIQGIGNPPSDEQSLQFLAAQILVHEVVLEERDAHFQYIGPRAGCSAVKSAYSWTSGDFSRRFQEIYNQMETQVRLYFIIPSFCTSTPETAPTFILDQYDNNTHEYFTNLTDNTNVCGSFFPAGYVYGDLTFTPWNDNHNLRVATRKTDFSERTAADGRNQPIKGLLYWGGTSSQQMCQCGGDIADPVHAFFKVKIGSGKIGMVNRCTYYGAYLSGARFEVYTSDGTDTGITLSSDAHSWTYSTDLHYGDYYLQELQPPQYYALQEKKYPLSIRNNGEKVKVETWSTPLSDVYPEGIAPNSAYRSNTEVIASYMIHNDSIAEHAPPRPLTVNQLMVHFTVRSDEMIVNSQTKKLDVPMFNQNLIYFAFTVPNGHKLKLTCEVEIPQGVVETKTDDKVVSQEYDIQPVPSSDTPDTKFESLPGDFTLPSESAEVPTGGIIQHPVDSSQWEQWEYNKGNWTLKTYGIRVSDQEKVTPDPADPSSSSSEGTDEIKSGYGIQFQSTTQTTPNGTMPPNDAYTSIQHGNLYFPEFEYSDKQDRYGSLDRINSSEFALKQNSFTTIKDGSKDYRRVHFTPLWFPDGHYVVKTFLYDCWTPAGMICVRNTASPLLIQGNMYNDWYIEHE